MKDFVIGTIVGSVIGAAAALMLAPKPGKELRGDVAVQAVSLKDKGVNLSSTAKEKTVQISNQLIDQSAQLVEKVKAKASGSPSILDDGTVSAEGEEPLEQESVSQATSNDDGTEKVEQAQDVAGDVGKAPYKPVVDIAGEPADVDPDLNR